MWWPETARATSEARRVLTSSSAPRSWASFWKTARTFPRFLPSSFHGPERSVAPADEPARDALASARCLRSSPGSFVRGPRGDLEELEGLAMDASGHLGLTGRVLLRHRRDLHGDSLDLIEDHLCHLVSAYDDIRREAR